MTGDQLPSLNQLREASARAAAREHVERERRAHDARVRVHALGPHGPENRTLAVEFLRKAKVLGIHPDNRWQIAIFNDSWPCNTWNLSRALEYGEDFALLLQPRTVLPARWLRGIFHPTADSGHWSFRSIALDSLGDARPERLREAMATVLNRAAMRAR